MEVKWEDRGKIPHDSYFQPYGPERGFEWIKVDTEMRNWWARVYDACVKAEKVMIAGGNTVLIVKYDENGV